MLAQTTAETTALIGRYDGSGFETHVAINPHSDPVVISACQQGRVTLFSNRSNFISLLELYSQGVPMKQTKQTGAQNI